jgi:hypothetical protein
MDGRNNPEKLKLVTFLPVAMVHRVRNCFLAATVETVASIFYFEGISGIERRDDLLSFPEVNY